jgi:hypothetical protein
MTEKQDALSLVREALVHARGFLIGCLDEERFFGRRERDAMERAEELRSALSALDQCERENGSARDKEVEACLKLVEDLSEDLSVLWPVGRWKEHDEYVRGERDAAESIVASLRSRITGRRPLPPPPEGASPLSDQRERV